MLRGKDIFPTWNSYDSLRMFTLKWACASSPAFKFYPEKERRRKKKEAYCYCLLHQMEFVCHGKFPHTERGKKKRALKSVEVTKKERKRQENASGAMGSRREKLPSETERRETRWPSLTSTRPLVCVRCVRHHIETDISLSFFSLLFLFCGN